MLEYGFLLLLATVRMLCVYTTHRHIYDCVDASLQPYLTTCPMQTIGWIDDVAAPGPPSIKNKTKHWPGWELLSVLQLLMRSLADQRLCLCLTAVMVHCSFHKHQTEEVWKRHVEDWVQFLFSSLSNHDMDHQSL